jgi:GT2 family glycosyltransferase
VVIDNQPGGAAPEANDRETRVVRDARQASSYYARNRGVEEAENDWILFVDSDCRPPASLLDAYFADPPSDGCGILAGGVVSAADQNELIAVYARTRNQVSERPHTEDTERPAGITANLLVRRAAWEEAGGFQEGVRSGADVEFCWRIRELGWSLVHRPEAAVEHVHPTGLGRLLAKSRRYGAGRLWVDRRYPGEAPPPPLLRELGRSAAGIVVWTMALRPRRALFKLIDALWFLAMARGYWAGNNRAPGSSPEVPDGGVLLVADEFPRSGENSGVAATTREIQDDKSLHVEASARPLRPDRIRSRMVSIAYREDDPPMERLRAVAGVWLSNPIRAFAAGSPRSAATSESLAALAPAARRVRGAKPRKVALDATAGSAEERLLTLAGFKGPANRQ